MSLLRLALLGKYYLMYRTYMLLEVVLEVADMFLGTGVTGIVLKETLVHQTNAQLWFTRHECYMYLSDCDIRNHSF